MKSGFLLSQKDLLQSVEKLSLKGSAGFLLGPTPSGTMFTREQFTEEQKEVGKIATDFANSKIRPNDEKIEHKAKEEDGTPTIIKLVKEAGELGLLGIDLPEEYGGLNMDFTTMMCTLENLAINGSYAATHIAHLGIGTLPILFFGNEEQKKKYLPKLATGEWISCYALTEPGSGSDALSGKTKAVLEGDYYILNGTKQYITNGSWADLAIVFARLDNQYTGFIVELNQPGISRGAEEKKMGIKGSSTVSLIFENAKVPKENLLGKVGDAATIALNILNLGRLELGFATLGAAKDVAKYTIEYGKQRKQFARPVIEFDMQMAKLADMVSRIFSLDALIYRTVSGIDAGLKSKGGHSASDVDVIRNYAIEASICKVEGSEMLAQVAGDSVKMMGGYGYCEEYRSEKAVRDCFINMIFEGTNDINRLVIFDFLVKGIYNQEIPFRDFMEMVESSLEKKNLAYPIEDSILSKEKHKVYAAKCLTAWMIQQCIIQHGKDIKNQQQVMKNISDMVIQIYAADSSLSRAHYLLHDKKHAGLVSSLVRLIVSQSTSAIQNLGSQVFASLWDTPSQKKQEEWNQLCSWAEYKENIFALKQEIAKATLEEGLFI
ncbi:MAG: acyl-CoA dehydrogenase family protein [Candidatus Brocadiae bacterium]|nr:acyl-CoA dehydrogenase family protein [Candidatus Brocadiia bacterium]